MPFVIVLAAALVDHIIRVWAARRRPLDAALIPPPQPNNAQ
jgi:hypothetical protein